MKESNLKWQKLRRRKQDEKGFLSQEKDRLVNSYSCFGLMMSRNHHIIWPG